jgi:hypothetical protein
MNGVLCVFAGLVLGEGTSFVVGRLSNANDQRGCLCATVHGYSGGELCGVLWQWIYEALESEWFAFGVYLFIILNFSFLVHVQRKSILWLFFKRYGSIHVCTGSQFDYAGMSDEISRLEAFELSQFEMLRD